MRDLKRDWPKKGQRAVRGFFFGAEALGLSLEATGLAAYIYSWDTDDIDEEVLRSMFPDRDLDGPLRELVSIGLIQFFDSSVVGPLPEPKDDVRYRRAGTIYLVEGNGRYKIGISQQSAKARLRSLQTGSPVPLKIIHSAIVCDCGFAEQLAHGLLMRFRLHGEWFECTEERARS